MLESLLQGKQLGVSWWEAGLWFPIKQESVAPVVLPGAWARLMGRRSTQRSMRSAIQSYQLREFVDVLAGLEKDQYVAALRMERPCSSS